MDVKKKSPIVENYLINKRYHLRLVTGKIRY